jgi:hypothetical protein
MLIRDRKMYVVPTPFRIADGLAHQYTLILPTHAPVNEEFFMVGELTRIEAPDLVVGYTFDLQMNEIRAQKVPNPTSGTKHLFRAWRLKGSSNKPVTMRDIQQISIDFAGDDEGTHE